MVAAGMTEQRQTTKIVLVAVLAIALVSVLIVRTGVLPFGSGKGGSGAGSRGKAASSATGDAKSGAPSGSIAVKWKRPDAIGPVVSDPMRMDLSAKKPGNATTPAPVVEVEPEFRVAGIIYSTQQPSSIIIDGRILHEGDTIHGATVVKITENYAELWRGDKKWQIKAGQTNKEPK
jgi:hypothetical protein